MYIYIYISTHAVHIYIYIYIHIYIYTIIYIWHIAVYLYNLYELLYHYHSCCFICFRSSLHLSWHFCMALIDQNSPWFSIGVQFKLVGGSVIQWKRIEHRKLVAGLNPSEKYESQFG